ncbi:hypothetical protein TWF281_006542 [Arthrobotrys megalospora]
MTRRHIPTVYKISGDEMIALIMRSKQYTEKKDWYKIIEEELIRRGAPNDEETTKKARCLTGRIRKVMLLSLVADLVTY